MLQDAADALGVLSQLWQRGALGVYDNERR
jgi:hypothetical protein